MALVSVIMTCYNHQSFIGEAIRSVIDQGFKDWELIVLDDDSTDGSREIIQKFAAMDSRISYRFDDKNLGKSKRLNTILDKVQTPYIAFLDSDDVMKSNRLEHQLKVLDENPEIGVCYTEGWILDSREVKSDGNVWGMEAGKKYFSDLHGRPEHTSSNLFDELLNGNFIFYSSTMLRRTAMEGLQFREVRIGEDWLFWLDIASRGWDFQYLKEPLTWYRLHGTNLMSDIWKEEAFLESMELVLKERGNEMDPKMKARKNYSLSRFFHGKNKNKARYYAAKAVENAPLNLKYRMSCLQIRWNL